MMPISSDRFDRKLLFSVRQDLAAERSRCRISLAGSEAQSPVVDVWSIQAPDFSPKLYMSLSGPRSDRGFHRRPQALSSGDTGKTPGRDQDDLPNMATVSKKDLGDLEFRLNHRDICSVKTTRSESDLTSRDTIKTMMKMDTYKPAEPTWDLRLLLPKPQWPPKSASFTRHRRSRAAYSAFMERVEEKLSTSWSQRA
ncbi:unnamed protein product [Merluccius merluccius]